MFSWILTAQPMQFQEMFESRARRNAFVASKTDNKQEITYNMATVSTWNEHLNILNFKY